jgi:primosomal protein N' (replication factor Y)
MPEFCDVAVPVPLDAVFTYRTMSEQTPVVGGRVLVPFRAQRLSGIAVELHDRKPRVKTKDIIRVLDDAPVLDAQLLGLGKWISDYYLAPIGEVFRTMLPLAAEFKKTVVYRITEAGHKILYEAGTEGSSARSRKTPEEQMGEFRVLEILAEREGAREESLRASARVSRQLLAGMVRKNWLAREDTSNSRDAARTVRVASLKSGEGKLNANQKAIIDALTSAGGKVVIETLRELKVPRTTLTTLVKRRLVELIDEPADFSVSGMKARQSPFNFLFNAEQALALEKIQAAVNAREYGGLLLHGITGSGKTAVYLAAMRSVLEAGRSSILLVPEIGLTPAVAADLHQVFGGEVAILHSALSDQERAEQWHRIKRGESRVVVGTR